MFLNLEEFDDVAYASTVKCDDEDWTMVEEGDWISSVKWEHQTCVDWTMVPERDSSYL